MSINASAEYQNPRDLLKAVKARVAARSKATGQPIEVVQRDFVFQRFLARLFETPGSRWVLKGGTGLRLRLPKARYSRDIDLLHLGLPGQTDILQALREDLVRRPADQIWFDLAPTGRPSGINPVTTVSVSAYIGAKQYLAFTLDLAHDLHVVGEVEHVQPEPALEVRGLPDPPLIPCYPLTDQVADKLCAMYETTASGPSSRYRDLVDLVLILRFASLDATQLRTAIASETTRRSMAIHLPLREPGPHWADGYTQQAREWEMSAERRDVDAAIALVGRCVEPLLRGDVTTGAWNPGIGWVPAAKQAKGGAGER